MIFIREDILSSGGVPHSDRPITTARGDALAIGRPGYPVHRPGRIRCRQHRLKVAWIGQDVFPCGSIPYLYSSIVAPRGDALAIGGPRRRSYGASVTLIGHETLSRRGIPYLHGVILARGSDAGPIGRPGHRIESVGILLIRQNALAGGRIPYLHSSILTPRGDTCAVGRPAHTTNRTRMPAIDEQRMAPIGGEEGISGRAGLDERGSRIPT